MEGVHFHTSSMASLGKRKPTNIIRLVFSQLPAVGERSMAGHQKIRSFGVGLADIEQHVGTVVESRSRKPTEKKNKKVQLALLFWFTRPFYLPVR